VHRGNDDWLLEETHHRHTLTFCCGVVQAWHLGRKIKADYLDDHPIVVSVEPQISSPVSVVAPVQVQAAEQQELE